MKKRKSIINSCIQFFIILQGQVAILELSKDINISEKFTLVLLLYFSISSLWMILNKGLQNFINNFFASTKKLWEDMNEFGKFGTIAASMGMLISFIAINITLFYETLLMLRQLCSYKYVLLMFTIIFSFYILNLQNFKFKNYTSKINRYQKIYFGISAAIAILFGLYYKNINDYFNGKYSHIVIWITFIYLEILFFTWGHIILNKSEK